MTIKVPPTEAQAKLQCTFVPNITAMHVEKYGAHIRNPPACPVMHEGALCASYPSDDGKHVFAVYCDGQGNCTRRYECPA